MAKDNLEDRIRAVLLYTESKKEVKEISSVMNVSVRTIRRWVRKYRTGGIKGLVWNKCGPPRGTNSVSSNLRARIIRLKQKHPSWGARRIKYQYELPCHWRTVHRIIKSNGMLVRIKPKPQPSRRFQRRYVDSMWQGDTFQFRISGTGKVYVTGFTDDRSRFRIISKAYLHKSTTEAVDALCNALKKGRTPREIYLDNGRQFTSNEFKDELAKYHIKPIYGRPYHPRGRGKIERYHKILYKELITQVRFSSLPHFKRELRKFDRKYNCWRKSQALGWKTPASVYDDKRYFGKRVKIMSKE
ncbi:MAG: DDE-type integrase/transposase/recombinase [Streptosporangiaceae bacterium]